MLHPRHSFTPPEGEASSSAQHENKRARSSGRQLHFLVVFAGPCEDDHALPLELRRDGHIVTAVDTKVGGESDNVLRRTVIDPLLLAIASQQYDAVFIATPCSSYSVRHPRKLSSRKNVRGVIPMYPEWAAYVSKHNRLADISAEIMEACTDAGIPWALENPADRGDDTSPAHWEQHADHGSLWMVDPIRNAIARANATSYTFAQCATACGGKAQKWTTIAASGALALELVQLRACGCTHGDFGHTEVLDGADEHGRSRATMAAAYPKGLAMLIAGAMARAGAFHTGVGETVVEDTAPTQGTSVSGGFARDGFELCEAIDGACESARKIPAAFASMRNLDPEPRSKLKFEAFGGNLRNLARPTRPRSACKAKRRKPLPRAQPGSPDHPAPAHQAPADGQDSTSTGKSEVNRAADSQSADGAATAQDGEPHGPTSRHSQRPPDFTRGEVGYVPQPVWCELPLHIRAKGAVQVQDLFHPGLYDSEVGRWRELASLAAQALIAGRAPPHVPTVVLEQWQQPQWARGIVWDTRSPSRCIPVKRSDRQTVFPGGKQLDREQVRKVAAELDWDSIDPDLINQIGEGGIETRSECELITVLTFHHDSLIRELEGASRDVQTGMAEGWVAAPVPDLPFVPCRMQPRGVVMQARSRVGEDGKLEEYLKPRITTDNSFGGIDSCNAAVAGSERAIELPSAQSLGRGWAICQSAFDNARADEGGGTPVGGYCIDAESAYRFCPVQQADWWQQVFCWWDAEGNAGFAVDTRMGFGGAFAPNRFERVSTLVCAVAATMQSAFDAEQPPPICARRWKEDRMSMQADGTLPAGRFQADPAYIQSFIDDFTGCASTDTVVPPPEVAEVVPDLPNMLKAGCTPPDCNSRLFVHAQLTVLALRRVGLVAAPAKVMIGSPLPALGLRFDGARRTIDCPEGKQRAVVAACEQAAERLTSTGEVDRIAARRLVGRLCNLSQVAPELRYHLHGGYAVTEVSWTARGARVFEPTVNLKRGSVPHSNWTGLLATAIEVVQANRGAAMAPRRKVMSRRAGGSLTSATDASGIDGVGGYAFRAEQPDTVYLMSAAWPDDVLRALQATASVAEAELRRASDPRAQPHLPMPAGELFGSWLLPTLISEQAPFKRCFAVGDCMPAVGVTNNLHSNRHTMRSLADEMRGSAWSWLGVHVKRELNRDPDKLSHPQMAAAVAAECDHLHVEWVSPRECHWDVIRAAIAQGTAKGGTKRKRAQLQRGHGAQ